jgi:hypothetical protein
MMTAHRPALCRVQPLFPRSPALPAGAPGPGGAWPFSALATALRRKPIQSACHAGQQPRQAPTGTIPLPAPVRRVLCRALHFSMTHLCSALSHAVPRRCPYIPGALLRGGSTNQQKSSDSNQHASHRGAQRPRCMDERDSRFATRFPNKTRPQSKSVTCAGAGGSPRMSCEWAQRSKLQMRVTGTLRGAERWSVPGSRARRRRTDHFENVPLGLGMNREAMLASIRNGAEAGLGRDLLATQLAESEHVSQPPPGSPGMHRRLA